ncbi:MAG: hypothetical protein ACRELY_33075 [Polyangiaceae bacterium]
MRRGLGFVLFGGLLFACSSSSTSSGGAKLRSSLPTPDTGLTAAAASCSVTNGTAADSHIDLACAATVQGPHPPPTVRVAIRWTYWEREADGLRHIKSDVVQERGLAPTDGTTFNPPLEIPPDNALVEGNGFGTYVLYEDLDGDGALTTTDGSGYSPDVIVAVARHLMIYSKVGGFQIEEDSPVPDGLDCVGAPCLTPFDGGSALLGPGTKIELDAVGPVTGQLYTCSPMVGGEPPGVPPQCTSSTAAAGQSVYCYDNGSDIYIGSCTASAAACAPSACSWCQVAQFTNEAELCGNPGPYK